MKNTLVASILSLSFICALAPINALAQAPASLDQVAPGYQPTVFTSKDQIQKIFDDMPWSFRAPSLLGLNQGSQCYMRAQAWSYDLSRNQNVKAMKAFVFYTHTYKKVFKAKNHKKFDWWFHVTPYLLLKNPETQNIEEWTIDATFSDEILQMKPWTDIFVDTKKPCAEFVPYKQFRCEVEGASDACPKVTFGSEHCYLVRVPGTIYQPEDVEAYQAGGQTGADFIRSQVVESLRKAPLRSAKDFWADRLGFSRSEIKD